MSTLSGMGLIYPSPTKTGVVPKKSLLLDGSTIQKAAYPSFFKWIYANNPVCSSVAVRTSKKLYGQFATVSATEVSLPIMFPIRCLDPTGSVNKDMKNNIPGAYQGIAYMNHQHNSYNHFRKSSSKGNWGGEVGGGTLWDWFGNVINLASGVNSSNYFQPGSIVYNWFIKYSN